MQNLWPELNNAQPSPGSAGQAQEPPRRRRLTEQGVLLSLRDWLLHDFAFPYCRTLSATRIYHRCYWIDALGSIESRTNAKTEIPSMPNGDILHDHPVRGREKDRRGDREGRPAIPAILQSIISLTGVLAQESKAIALHGIVLEAGSSKRKETTPR